jgi:hypothetical protein
MQPPKIIDVAPVAAAALPYVVATQNPGYRCVGFRAVDAGTVSVSVRPDRKNNAVTRALPVNATSGMEWRVEGIRAVTGFTTTTAIWLFLAEA